ncbi:hypothetical protein QL285_033297 [Trifolium repens]|nr:hypothetical protein QL285_033297 [Trifolium repens]
MRESERNLSVAERSPVRCPEFWRGRESSGGERFPVVVRSDTAVLGDGASFSFFPLLRSVTSLHLLFFFNKTPIWIREA